MKTMKSDNLIINIKGFFDEIGWDYYFDPAVRTFYFRLNVDKDNGTLNYMITTTEQNSFAIQAISTVRADASNKNVMMNLSEFIIRINSLLRFQNGNVDLDMNSGQISYTAFFPFEDITPSTKMIRYGMYLPAVVWEKIGYCIRMIIKERMSGLDAFEQCKDDLIYI